MVYLFTQEEIQYQLEQWLKNSPFEPAQRINFVCDGQIHRYDLAGEKPGKKTGAYCLFSQDWPTGWFKNWRKNKIENWHFPKDALSDSARRYFSKDQITSAIKRSKERREKLYQELDSGAVDAAEACTKLFGELPNPPESFQYFKDKGVRALGPIRFNPERKCLAIPLMNSKREIVSMQFISEDGGKKFYHGGKTGGAFFPIDASHEILANPDDTRPVLIGEGYATMATVYDAVKCPCLCAMTCGNLYAVAQEMKKLYPKRKIIIAADNDVNTKGNPGLTAAQEAARKLALDGVVVPYFKHRETGTDWNDYMKINGLEAVTETLESRLALLMLPKYQQAIMSKVSQINAEKLKRKRFKPVTWAVDGFIPSGLTVLAGGPKVGKSIFALHVSLAVALGGSAFGSIPCEQGDVLYLALEDTERRLQERILNSNWGIDDDTDLSRLTLATVVPKQHEGGIKYISWWCEAHPDARLIIIDTLQKFRKQLTGKNNVYAEDYETVAEIKALADYYDVPVFVIHHLKKGASEDWINEISGSQGIAGAADTLFSLKRARQENTGILARTGRDVEEKQFSITLDKFGWRLEGECDANDIAAPSWERVILDLLRTKGAMSPTEITEATGFNGNTIRTRLRKLSDAGKISKTGIHTYSIVEKNPPAIEKSDNKGLDFSEKNDTIFHGTNLSETDFSPF